MRWWCHTCMYKFVWCWCTKIRANYHWNRNTFCHFLQTRQRLLVPWQQSDWIRTQNEIEHGERCTTEIWWNKDWTSISDGICPTQVYGRITWQCSTVEWRKYKAPYTLYLEEKPAIEASFLTTDTKGQTTLKRQNNCFYQVQGLLDIFDLPFCSYVVAGFDDFLYICINRERDFFAPSMRTQLDSFYFGAVLPELTFPMKICGGLRTAMSIEH